MCVTRTIGAHPLRSAQILSLLYTSNLQSHIVSSSQERQTTLPQFLERHFHHVSYRGTLHLEIQDQRTHATEGEFGRLRTGSGLENDALASPEGQERAVREATENLRLLYVGCTRAMDKIVFAHRDGKYQWLAQLPNVDTILDCGIGDGERALDGIDTSFVV